MRSRRAFTLIELLAVLAIIGILLSFIMIAAVGAARDAQARATQALIAKLDSGLGDRLEALLAQRVNPQPAHLQMAYAWVLGRDYKQTGFNVQTDRDAFQRAGVLARYDQIKSEVPDSFIVQDTTLSANYPLNFGMTPFTAWDPNVDFQCVTPIGNGSKVNGTAGTGIYGASYPVLAGIYKNLGKYSIPATGNGFSPQGYNGVDDNGNALVDDIGESGKDGSIQTALNNHKHVTCRAEALYALLIEGQGPYGSVLNRDDFTSREVQDTDQDGLPEFVDGWGNPLQFYRWPILYHSDVQRGMQMVGSSTLDPNYNAVCTAVPPYASPFDAREVDPLDQNQELVMPDWWSSVANSQNGLWNSQGTASGGAAFVSTYFHQLTDPLTGPTGYGSPGASSPQVYWDRSVPGAAQVLVGDPPVQKQVSLYPRRAFYTRFLILSSGPDGKPGTPYLTDPRAADIFGASPPSPPYFASDSALKSAVAGNPTLIGSLLGIESQAAQASLRRSSDEFQTPFGVTAKDAGTHPQDNYYANQLQNDGQDDITNHSLNSTAGPVQ